MYTAKRLMPRPKTCRPVLPFFSRLLEPFSAAKKAFCNRAKQAKHQLQLSTAARPIWLLLVEKDPSTHFNLQNGIHFRFDKG